MPYVDPGIGSMLIQVAAPGPLVDKAKVLQEFDEVTIYARTDQDRCISRPERIRSSSGSQAHVRGPAQRRGQAANRATGTRLAYRCAGDTSDQAEDGLGGHCEQRGVGLDEHADDHPGCAEALGTGSRSTRRLASAEGT